MCSSTSKQDDATPQHMFFSVYAGCNPPALAEPSTKDTKTQIKIFNIKKKLKKKKTENLAWPKFHHRARKGLHSFGIGGWDIYNRICTLITVNFRLLLEDGLAFLPLTLFFFT